MRRLACWALGWCLCLSLLTAVGLLAQETSSGQDKPSSLTLTALRLEPAVPAPNTLCRLWVSIRNDGDRVASLLHFRVLFNGQEVGTYGGDSFVVPLPPGTTQEIRLFNVWSSETGRPAAPGGRLELEVTLEAATWIDITTSVRQDGSAESGSRDDVSEGGGSQEDGSKEGISAQADDAETWTPVGPVLGLPSTLRQVIQEGPLMAAPERKGAMVEGRKGRKWAANLGVMAGTVLLLLAVFELSLRLTGFSFVLYPQDIEFGRPDPVMIESGFLEDDDVFWVTRDYPQKLGQLTEDPPQWVFLGDSCTHLGHYDTALAQRMAARRGSPLSYANLAVAGWSSYQGRQQLARDVVPLAPAVVSIYFGWNDHWIGFGIEDKNVGRVKQVFSSRWSQLRLVQLVSKAVVAWGARETAYPNRVSELDFADNLRAMVDASRSAGIHPILITAGTSHRQGQEPAHLTQRWLRDLGDLVPLHQRYVDAVRRVAAERQATLCDAAAAFEQLPKERLGELFMQDGIHLTTEGDAYLAELLDQCVVDAGLDGLLE